SVDHVTATGVLHTLSLHDALPISGTPNTIFRRYQVDWKLLRLRASASYIQVIKREDAEARRPTRGFATFAMAAPNLAGWKPTLRDRKSTRLNSSHVKISYAVFCLK